MRAAVVIKEADDLRYQSDTCTQQEKENHAQEILKYRLTCIKYRILVMSGKDSVGKRRIVIMVHQQLNEVDKVEILTLLDNYIDITSGQQCCNYQGHSLKDGSIRQSILAEHGYCAIVKTTTDDRTRTLLFDFGFSEEGAAYNAKALRVDMRQVEAVALSHGHSDHTGGLAEACGNDR